MKNTLKELITKSFHGILNEEESNVLYTWIQESKANEELYVKLRDINTLQNMQQHYQPQTKSKLLWIVKLGSVAAAIVILTTVVFNFWKSNHQTSLQNETEKK